MRPRGPLPRTTCRSTPSSRARRRTAGPGRRYGPRAGSARAELAPAIAAAGAADCAAAGGTRRLTGAFRLQREQHLPHLDRLALLDVELDDLAGVGAGDFDDRLFRFQFDNALVGRDLSPSWTRMLTMSPLATFSPNSGSLKSMAHVFLTISAGQAP